MTPIYQCTAGFTTYRWLCDEHKRLRELPENGRWEHKRIGETVHDCEDCSKTAPQKAFVPVWPQVHEGELLHRDSPSLVEAVAEVDRVSYPPLLSVQEAGGSTKVETTSRGWKASELPAVGEKK